jgi:hypothetical protein
MRTGEWSHRNVTDVEGTARFKKFFALEICGCLFASLGLLPHSAEPGAMRGLRDVHRNAQLAR